MLTGVPTACNISSPPTTESQPILISPAAEPPQVAVDGPSVPAAPTGNDEQPTTCGTTKQLSFEVKYLIYISGEKRKNTVNNIA